MGEISVHIQLHPINDALGWTYSEWTIDYGKGQKPTTEQVIIKCAETSQRYMGKEEAIAEAQGRIRAKIHEECGDVPEEKITWKITEKN